MTSALQTLLDKGVRYSTVIDVGCADGNFFLLLSEMGLAPGATPLNLDANAVYRESLEAIRDVVGGHFRICAVADREGDIELTQSTHPYWSSLRPEGDLYWQRINNLSTSKAVVPATTLDVLRRELNIQPPFLIKLDVQGAELSVLRGAREVLADALVVICEADIDDFQDINAALVEAGFVLYDMVHLQRLSDGTLGWFYPIYVKRTLTLVLPQSFWDAKDNDAVTRLQEQRRTAILQSNREALQRIRAQRSGKISLSMPLPPVSAVTPQPAISRNQLCPCGSGKRYKHCHGAHA